MHDGEPTTCIKFINLYKKSRQNLRQQICRKPLFTSTQSDPDRNQEWLGCVGTKWRKDKFGITNFSLALFDIWSHIANEAMIVFGLGLWWIQHPLTTKHLKVEWNMSHIMRAKHLIGSFAKLTTHRHCRLLWTKSWSHKQSKLMCCQLSKKYKINWVCLWTRSCCQWKKQESPLQSWIILK